MSSVSLLSNYLNYLTTWGKPNQLLCWICLHTSRYRATLPSFGSAWSCFLSVRKANSVIFLALFGSMFPSCPPLSAVGCWTGDVRWVYLRLFAENSCLLLLDLTLIYSNLFHQSMGLLTRSTCLENLKREASDGILIWCLNNHSWPLFLWEGVPARLRAPSGCLSSSSYI